MVRRGAYSRLGMRIAVAASCRVWWRVTTWGLGQVKGGGTDVLAHDADATAAVCPVRLLVESAYDTKRHECSQVGLISMRHGFDAAVRIGEAIVALLTMREKR
jgi:hypothetical protein